MAKPRKKKRQPSGKKQIETALPKRQYKRTNRLLYVVSGILLVVFGGGAALIGAGAPPAPTPTPVPAVSSSQQGSSVGQTQFTTTPTPVAPTSTPTP